MALITRFILLLAIVANYPFNPVVARTTAHLELIHRDQLLGHHRETRVERLRQMLSRDKTRMQRICAGRSQRTTTVRRQTLQSTKAAATASTPLSSGRDSGTGEYFAKIYLGTPAQQFSLVADTGSDLTWVNCRPKKKGEGGGFFDARRSKSFKHVTCKSGKCPRDIIKVFGASFTRCGAGHSGYCGYNYSYTSGFAVGDFITESVAFDRTKTQVVENVVIGCGNSNQGLDSVLKGADGMMGLGNSDYSLPMQASKLFGKSFSYCLVDHLSHGNVAGKLVLGGRPPMPRILQYTTLDLVSFKSSALYGVNIRSIRINGKSLNIPPETWSNSYKGKGGAIIDSGTISNKKSGTQ